MNLMFWKKKTSGNTEESMADEDRTVAISRDTETTEESGEEYVRPGLLTRLRNTLSALRKPRGPGAENDGDEAETPETATPEQRGDEMPGIVPVHNLKKRLIVGGAISLIVLLLAGFGFAIIKIFLSEPEQNSATAEASQTSHLAPHAAPTQNEIDELKKKNAALQAQIEAMQKEQPQQQTPASPGMATQKNTTASSSDDSGEMTISNKDPKAAAQVLKNAIEAMNAGSGGQKPHKPSQ